MGRAAATSVRVYSAQGNSLEERERTSDIDGVRDAMFIFKSFFSLYFKIVIDKSTD